jgi:predicted DNA-binding protein with PD1-like motif
MYTHAGDGYGRHVIMQLTKGELILESITSELDRLGIRCGLIVSGIGSARKVVYHRIESLSDDPENTFITVEEPMEVGSMQGVIVDGKPHIHISCCCRDYAFAGHLEPGSETQYLIELGIIELKGADLVRKTDAFGISFIDVR